MLNPLQKDVLTELVNVYVGQAGSLLSEMVNQKINLSVPEVELISVSDEASFFNYLSIFPSGHIISSSIRFGHVFEGKALLVFPLQEAKIIVNACLGETYPPEGEIMLDLLDTDFDVLKEISNVILNAVIGEFGNLLGTRLEYSLPEIEIIYVSEAENKEPVENNLYILVLHTSFLLADAQVQGVILLVLSMNSVNWLIRKIDQLLGEVNG
jgi:chemotaxis protein CheC